MSLSHWNFEIVDWIILDCVVLNIIGARLIINIRKANCSLAESLVSKEIASRSLGVLHFRHTTEHVEEDVSNDESDEIREERR
ncbi:hypothetical protein AN958_09386 [Leucoagaricus sp. SymC.cos]|nr:hypothetical protein AN958_09386 [Leucoagaricus sp. SymC.cos]